MVLQDDRIIHLRLSGNAPELRIYIEAETPARARDTLAFALTVVGQDLVTDPK